MSPNTLIKRIGRSLPHSANFHARRVLFFGTAHRCVLCRSRIRRYRDIGGLAPVLEEKRVVGGMARPADKCPVCSALDRTRLMMLYWDQRIGTDGEAMRVLHLAPDLGLYLFLSRQPGLDYTLGDLNPERYKFSKAVKRCDITALPFDDASFDVLIASHILEHIPDDHLALTEIRRVLRPGGRALLMTPISLDLEATYEDPGITGEEVRLAAFGQEDHVRIYAHDFADRIDAAGLAVEEFKAAGQGDATVERLRLNPLETLYVGHVEAGSVIAKH